MKKLKKRVLAEGEVTGHAHRTTVDVYEDEEGYRSFTGATKVTHEEHHVLEIPESPTGEWESGVVQEWNSFEEAVRNVRD